MQSGREDTLEERYEIKFCFKLGKMPQKRIECFRLLLDHHAWIEHQFLNGIRDSKKGRESVRDDEKCGWSKESIHQSWLAKGLGLGLLCWGFKGVQDEIPREETRTFQIGSVAFPRWASRPIVQTLLPVTFAYSLSSEAVVMRQLRWQRLWRACQLTQKDFHGALQPEEITSTGIRVSCVYYQ